GADGAAQAVPAELPRLGGTQALPPRRPVALHRHTRRPPRRTDLQRSVAAATAVAGGARRRRSPHRHRQQRAPSARRRRAADVRRVWDLLIAHAAVTAQCHVVFVNRSGTENDRRFWGGSCVVGPDGQTLVRLGEDPDTVEVKLDLAMVRDLRRRWPLLQEPRFELIACETARLAAQQ